MLSFDNSTPQNWAIASAAGGIANFSSSKLRINALAFQNELGGGSFRLATNSTSLLLSFVSQPNITNLSIAGGNFAIGGGNGVPNATYYVLGSTNLTLPLGSWTRITTNAFDGNGNFYFSNAIDPALSQQFFLLQMP